MWDMGLHTSLLDGFQPHPNSYQTSRSKLSEALYQVKAMLWFRDHLKHSLTKNIRILQEFKGGGTGDPFLRTLFLWPFVLVRFGLRDFGRVTRVLHIPSQWEQGLLHPPAQILSTIVLSAWVLHIPRVSPQGLMSFTRNRNKHTQLEAWVKSDYLTKRPSPWPFPQSHGIGSECNLDCIGVLFGPCSTNSLALLSRR